MEKPSGHGVEVGNGPGGGMGKDGEMGTGRWGKGW